MLHVSIIKTNFLAYTKKDGNTYLLGSNGKLIKSMESKEDKPFIFGKFLGAIEKVLSRHVRHMSSNGTYIPGRGVGGWSLLSSTCQIICQVCLHIYDIHSL